MMELAIVFNACECVRVWRPQPLSLLPADERCYMRTNLYRHYVEVAADVHADGRVALSQELLQLQLLSLVGVAPPAQALLSSRGQLLLAPNSDATNGAADTEDDELLLPLHEGERRPRLFLFSLDGDAPSLAVDWPSVCSRAAFGSAPVVQRAFVTPVGRVICQMCAETCTSCAYNCEKVLFSSCTMLKLTLVCIYACMGCSGEADDSKGLERIGRGRAAVHLGARGDCGRRRRAGPSRLPATSRGSQLLGIRRPRVSVRQARWAA